MRRIALLIVLVMGLAAASAARSQQPATGDRSKPATTVTDSVVFKPSPELRKSLDELAASIQALAQRIATDPEIKTAAMNVASGFVITAQQVIVEQSGVLEEALKKAAQQINAQKEQLGPRKK